MSTTSTRLTYDEFLKLPEQEGTHYELDEGELVMEPSPTFLHNRIRDRIARTLFEFVEAQRLGEVIVEMDFRLAADTVRQPGNGFRDDGSSRNHRYRSLPRAWSAGFGS